MFMPSSTWPIKVTVTLRCPATPVVNINTSPGLHTAVPVGKVPDAVPEADLAQLVVVGQKISERFDLFGVWGGSHSLAAHFAALLMTMSF
jgi:hypothetical protein